jgi:MerR family mercuric resistance operon transcriptional regulator
MRRLTIGELSRRTGVNIETIRYFERVGLIPAPPRTNGGHRSYDESHASALRFIRSARELGFAPDEVRAILQLGGPGAARCDEVRDIAAHHLDRVRAKIADLERLQKLIASAVEHCSGKATSDCAVIDLLQSAERDLGAAATA